METVNIRYLEKVKAEYYMFKSNRLHDVAYSNGNRRIPYSPAIHMRYGNKQD